MSDYVREGRESLLKRGLSELETLVEKDCWIALRQYFDGAKNGPEAKIACVVLSTLARKQQAANNARQLNILERRMLTEHSQPGPQQLGKETVRETP